MVILNPTIIPSFPDPSMFLPPLRPLLPLPFLPSSRPSPCQHPPALPTPWGGRPDFHSCLHRTSGGSEFEEEETCEESRGGLVDRRKHLLPVQQAGALVGKNLEAVSDEETEIDGR
eukprot:371031-Hanusia_phi.AAC.1